MADHYYTKDPTSQHKPGVVEYAYRGHSLRFDTDSGVFSRTEIDRGTHELLAALPDTLEGKLLDLGCGYGVIGISVGKAFPNTDVLMADINQRACDLSLENARKNGVKAQVLQSDGYENISGTGFDHILQNPPIRAGKAVIYAMFAEAAKRLAPGGRLWLVIRKQQGAESALRYLSTLFSNVETIAKKGGFWIICCSLPL
ncbi:MAG: class I SAM-dependent methyltransferase [Clostridiales bacterium]|nr:class I SAM-dependent methyltransferase [Clostridiales bacterium]